MGTRKVGDIVIIRSDIDKCDSLIYVGPMDERAGDVVTIAEVLMHNDDPYYKIIPDNCNWNWEECMFEPKVQKPKVKRGINLRN